MRRVACQSQSTETGQSPSSKTCVFLRIRNERMINMSELKQITSESEWESILQESNEKPVFLFKHSTTCPVSANAYKEYQDFPTNLDKYFLIVSESRPVSNQVAEDLGIKHESPQIFLLNDGKAVWNTSHWNITEENIKEALEQNK